MTAMQQAMMGGGGDLITLQSHTPYDTRAFPTNAGASVSLDASGAQFETTSAGGAVNTGNWVTPAANASLYEYRVTLNTGTLTSGTVGSWVTGTQTWAVTRSGMGIKNCNFLLEIRRISDGFVVAAVNQDITAEVA